MKVLLLKDVYKLGRAGDIKKVAGGYGRNYLIPQGMAILATPGSIKNAGLIKVEADKNREILNEEFGELATKLNGHQLTFAVRASETGKLYGSITTRMIATALNEEFESELGQRQIDSQPLRSLGPYKVSVRLTIDLAAEVEVIIYREGEGIESAYETFEEEVVEAEAATEGEEVEGEAEATEEAESEEESTDEAETEEAGDESDEAEVEETGDEVETDEAETEEETEKDAE